jgi:hypothetical protein
MIGRSFGASIVTFADTLADDDVVLISADRHHIGDGAYGRDSNCASDFELANLGPTYSERFVVFEEAIGGATLEIKDICGVEAGRKGIRVSLNFVEIGVVGNGTARIDVPPELFNLGGKDNILPLPTCPTKPMASPTSANPKWAFGPVS